MTTPTILIIDDDDQFSRYVAELVSGQGFNIHLAPNGKLGVEACLKIRPDAVLLDLVMPEMDGIETIQRIKSYFPDMPVITMSGGNHGPANVYLSVTEKLGAYTTLKKPFESQELLSALATLFPNNRFLCP